MIKLRITPDGRIRGLWTDHIQFSNLGALKVRRASHVEFDERQQCWCVRAARPESHLRQWLHRLFGRPAGRVLHRLSE